VGSIGPAEILVVLVVALVVLGPARLPEAARSVGKAMGELRRVTAGLQSEVRDAVAETPPAPPVYPTTPVDYVDVQPTEPDPAPADDLEG